VCVFCKLVLGVSLTESSDLSCLFNNPRSEVIDFLVAEPVPERPSVGRTLFFCAEVGGEAEVNVMSLLGELKGVAPERRFMKWTGG